MIQHNFRDKAGQFEYPKGISPLVLTNAFVIFVSISVMGSNITVNTKVKFKVQSQSTLAQGTGAKEEQTSAVVLGRHNSLYISIYIVQHLLRRYMNDFILPGSTIV